MKVVFIGAGNLASNLATELHKNSIEIVQIYSRTIESAKTLANQVKASFTNKIENICINADVYIFSVKDSVLEQLAIHLPSNRALWIHTAGSMPLSIFSLYTPNYGVLYPLQTFTKGREVDWKEIPIFIEANNAKNLAQLKKLANILSNNVRELVSDKRKLVHLTGVFACNFANHMYTLSEQILAEANLPFDVAIPLIKETCDKIQKLSPQEAQTGPAIRFDENVIDKHLELIKDEKTREIYRLISESIHTNSKK